MARLPRFVIPGQPQHASPLHGRGRFAGSRTSSCARQFPAQLQRGNNRQTIFAAEADYQFFRDALVEAAGRFDELIRSSVNQAGSRGADAVKYNFEGLSGSRLRNIGVPSTKLNEFNSLIRQVREYTGQ
jgi:hypothetical protein